jgi:hypothetical protein
MGAWGTGILDDDTACDVYDDYLNRFNEGEQHTAIRKALLEDYADIAKDKRDEYYSVFWLALAQAQWDCGALQPDTLRRIRRIVEVGEDRDWIDPKSVGRRKRVLSCFLNKISKPRVHPHKPRKPRFKPAIYEPGDCLAIHLPDGDYGAALVLVADNSGRFNGSNLIGLLHYKSPQKPTREVFKQPELLMAHHEWGDSPRVAWHGALDHRKGGKDLELLGNVPVSDDMPYTSNAVGGWYLGVQVMSHYARESMKHS